MGGFSLSVAVYVVKARAGKFKRKKKYKNCCKIRPFPQKRPDFMKIYNNLDIFGWKDLTF